MNPRETLNLVEIAISNRQTSKVDRWYLCISEGVIICEPLPTSEPISNLLMAISMSQVTRGFSGREWERIQARIKRYQEGNPEFELHTVDKPKKQKKTKKSSKKSCQTEQRQLPRKSQSDS